MIEQELALPVNQCVQVGNLGRNPLSVPQLAGIFEDHEVPFRQVGFLEKFNRRHQQQLAANASENKKQLATLLRRAGYDILVVFQCHLKLPFCGAN